MKQNFKRTIAMTLVVLLLFGLVPMTAFGTAPAGETLCGEVAGVKTNGTPASNRVVHRPMVTHNGVTYNNTVAPRNESTFATLEKWATYEGNDKDFDVNIQVTGAKIPIPFINTVNVLVLDYSTSMTRCACGLASGTNNVLSTASANHRGHNVANNGSNWCPHRRDSQNMNTRTVNGVAGRIPTRLDELRVSVNTFLNSLTSQDYVAIVTYNATATRRNFFQVKNDSGVLNTNLTNALNTATDSSTNIHGGIIAAYQLMHNPASFGVPAAVLNRGDTEYNVIVMSDGTPTTFHRVSTTNNNPIAESNYVTMPTTHPRRDNEAEGKTAATGAATNLKNLIVSGTNRGGGSNNYNPNNLRPRVFGISFGTHISSDNVAASRPDPATMRAVATVASGAPLFYDNKDFDPEEIFKKIAGEISASVVDPVITDIIPKGFKVTGVKAIRNGTTLYDSASGDPLLEGLTISPALNVNNGTADTTIRWDAAGTSLGHENFVQLVISIEAITNCDDFDAAVYPDLKAANSTAVHNYFNTNKGRATLQYWNATKPKASNALNPFATDIATPTVHVPKLRGSLIIVKNFAGDVTSAPAGWNATFNVINEAGDVVATRTYANISVPVTNLLPGLYTVEEIGGGIAGYDLNVTPGSATVVSGGTATATVTNTYNRLLGNLEITKTFGGAYTSAPAGFDATFKLYAGPSAVGTPIDEVDYADFVDGSYTFYDLPIGIYTVVEEGGGINGYSHTIKYSVQPLGGDAGPVEDYEDSVSVEVTTGEGKTSVHFLNEYTKIVGNLTIIKASNDATLIPANTKFTVIGENGNVIINGKDHVLYSEFTDGSYTIPNLPIGDYTVIEDRGTAEVATHTLEVTGNNAPVVVIASGSSTTITNDYTLILGSLTITKAFTGEPVNVDPTFTVTSEKLAQPIVVKYSEFVPGNGVHVINNLVPGTYTVTETGCELPDYIWTATGDGVVTATVPYEGGNDTAAFTNNYANRPGSLTIDKEFIFVIGGEPVAGNWTADFRITGPSHPAPEGLVVYYTGTPITVNNLIPGDYIVTEIRSDVPSGYDPHEWDPAFSYEWEVTGTGSHEVNRNTNTPVNITNTATLIPPTKGSLGITKAFASNDGAITSRPTNWTADFSVTGPSGTATLSYPGNLNLNNLIPGTYTITETRADPIDGYDWTQPAPIDVVVGASYTEVAIGNFTNNYTLIVGSLEIEKKFEGAEAPAGGWAATFQVTGPNGYDETFSFSQFTNGKLLINNLVPGPYTVTEISASEIPGYDWSVNSDGVITVGVVRDETAEASFTNTYTLIVGSLTINKSFVSSVEGDTVFGAPEGGWKATFEVTSEKLAQPIVVNWEGAPIVINNLIPGVYTVTETSASTVTNYTLVVPGAETATVVRDSVQPQASVLLVNTYNPHDATVTVVKEWTFHGEPGFGDLPPAQEALLKEALSFTNNFGFNLGEVRVGTLGSVSGIAAFTTVSISENEIVWSWNDDNDTHFVNYSVSLVSQQPQPWEATPGGSHTFTFVNNVVKTVEPKPANVTVLKTWTGEFANLPQAQQDHLKALLEFDASFPYVLDGTVSVAAGTALNIKEVAKAWSYTVTNSAQSFYYYIEWDKTVHTEVAAAGGNHTFRFFNNVAVSSTPIPTEPTTPEPTTQPTTPPTTESTTEPVVTTEPTTERPSTSTTTNIRTRDPIPEPISEPAVEDIPFEIIIDEIPFVAPDPTEPEVEIIEEEEEEEVFILLIEDPIPLAGPEPEMEIIIFDDPMPLADPGMPQTGLTSMKIFLIIGLLGSATVFTVASVAIKSTKRNKA